MDRRMIAALQLVGPPLSNQHAEAQKEEIDNFMEASNLYMITQKEEAFFRNPHFDRDTHVFSFDLQCGKHNFQDLSIHLFDKIAAANPEDLKVCEHEKFIAVLSGDDYPFLAATPEGVLFHHSRRDWVIRGLSDAQLASLTRYKLLYVGIAKEQDATSRLVKRPHEKRLAALSNEFPIRSGARVTDELFLMFFKLGQLHIEQFDDSDSVEEMVARMMNPQGPDYLKIIADAEKALVAFTHAKYNTIKFKDFPKSIDGLFPDGLESYIIGLDEDITLESSKGPFRGAFGFLPNHHVGSRLGDAVFIRGESAELIQPEAGSSGPT